MRLKLFLCSLCLSAIAYTASAQDKINLQNGGVINAKVKEVSTRTITYKKQNNPDGPDFVIRKNEVESITYANGTTDKIDSGDDNEADDRRGRHHVREPREGHHFGLSNEQYPKNILSLAPMQMANEGPAGVGLHYERVIDKKSMFSFYLPVAAIFFTDKYNYYASSSSNTNKVNRTFIYAYPGVKVYPTGSNRRVSYALGASFALGFGDKYVSEYNSTTSTNYVERSVFKSGLLLNNSLNIQPTKHLFIGLELGLGFTYYNNEGGTNSTTFDTEDPPLVQFNFALGYRF